MRVHSVYTSIAAPYSDHAGGNGRLATLRPDLVFYGGDDRIEPATQKKVSHGDTIKVSAHL